MAILTLFAEVLKRRGSASLRVSVKTLLRFLPLALSLASGGALAQPCCGPPQTPEEALFRSIENGDLAEFSRLLDAGASLSARNRLGETLLYVAAEKGEIDMARLLIAKGADAKARTPNGETVLHAASMIESTALTTELIQAGAEVNAANQDGETPLQWAALT